MRRLAVFTILLIPGCLTATTGAQPAIRRLIQHRIRHLELCLLVLVFAIVSWPAVSNTAGICPTPPDTVAKVRILDTGTEIVPLGRGIWGLYAHYASPAESRAFRATARVDRLPAFRSLRPSLRLGNALYPLYRHFGQPIGLDRWFSDAVIPVKPAVILLC